MEERRTSCVKQFSHLSARSLAEEIEDFLRKGSREPVSLSYAVCPDRSGLNTSHFALLVYSRPARKQAP